MIGKPHLPPTIELQDVVMIVHLATHPRTPKEARSRYPRVLRRCRINFIRQFGQPSLEVTSARSKLRRPASLDDNGGRERE